MELDVRARRPRLVFTDQVRHDYCQVGCRDKEVCSVIQAELGRQGSDCAVAGGDVENACTMLQLAELVLPEIENDAVIVARFARAEGRNESLSPERGPLLVFVAADRTAPGLCVAGL